MDRTLEWVENAATGERDGRSDSDLSDDFASGRAESVRSGASRGSQASVRSLQLRRRRVEVRLKKLDDAADAVRRRRQLQERRRQLQEEEEDVQLDYERRSLQSELEEAQLDEEIAQLELEEESSAEEGADRPSPRLEEQSSALREPERRVLSPTSTEGERASSRRSSSYVQQSARPREPQEDRKSDRAASAEHQDASLASIRAMEGVVSSLAKQIASAVREPRPHDDCPRVQLQPFSGKPADFNRFMLNFEATVEPARKDPRTRLNLLIQYCKGDAACHIEDCVNLEPEDGYKRAKKILRERYGMPWKIAEDHVKTLTEGGPIKAGDLEGVAELAMRLRKCELNLRQMSFKAEVDNTETIRKVARRLPYRMREKWIELTHDIMSEEGRPASFADLSSFVNKQREIMSSVFASDLSNDHKRGASQAQAQLKPSKKPATTKATTYAGQGDRKGSPEGRPRNHASRACVVCDSSGCRELADCQKFKRLELGQRREAVSRARACFNCLKGGHRVRECPWLTQCDVPECKGKHHSSLHQWSPPTNGSERSAGDAAEPSPPVAQTGAVNTRLPGVHLGIIPVTLTGPRGDVRTCALLDNGSTTSFIDEEIATRLGLQGREISYKVSTITERGKSFAGRSVQVKVATSACPDGVLIENVWTSPKLSLSCDSAATTADIRKHPHLQNICLEDMPDHHARLLIGVGSGILTPLEVRLPPSSNLPYAERTLLGWVVRGPSGGSTRDDAATHFTHSQPVSTDQLQQNMERMWTTDFGELLNPDDMCMSVEDTKALQLMQGSMCQRDGHYEVALPWREDARLLNNRVLALARLRQVKKRLMTSPDLSRMYAAQMDEYIENGYAREVTPDEQDPPGRVWYLPHHPVFNDSKPGRVRVVFDGAAEYMGQSINSCLYQGPDLVNSLAGVLMRFRQEQIGVIADIRAMFHQVLVPRQDQAALRFLWWRDGDLSRAPTEFCMTRHVFGLRSSPSCAALALRQTATDNRSAFPEHVAAAVERSIYVDDLLMSASSPSSAVQTALAIREMLSRGGFQLMKFASNSKEVLERLPSELQAPQLGEIDLAMDSLPNSKTLGLSWETETDAFRFAVAISTQDPCTKRKILAAVATIYDPLGFVAPVLLEAKGILQSLTKMKIAWDDPVPPALLYQWVAWCKGLSALSLYSVKRAYGGSIGSSGATDCQLHVFCDASEAGYGACAYLRMNTAEGISVALVMGKSRLAPIKPVTIPRMELTAAMLGSRLRALVVRELDITLSSVTMWTDSTITLGYIANEKARYKTFVANRLAVIHELTSPYEWRHVPTKLNPADLASRGFPANDARAMALWLKGPSFLAQQPISWPHRRADMHPAEPLEDPEIKAVMTTDGEKQESAALTIVQHFSSWNRAVRATAWLRRWITLCRPPRRLSHGPLTVSELEVAEAVLLRAAQRRHFSKELADISLHGRVAKGSGLVDLDPQLEDGLLCTGSRLRFSKHARKLIILPKKDPLTRLIVRHAHVSNGHVGSEQVLAKTRERYWIVSGRSAVRSEIGQCFQCRRQKAPLEYQQMAPLREEQLAMDEPPFTHTGLDYFGPFNVKQGRSVVKRYGCLFTCLTMRAVHIEISHSLDTDSLLSAVTRFIARRGTPRKMHSDRGTNMTSADRELQAAVKTLDGTKLQASLGDRRIEWQFNPPHASHRGGLWERLIRSTRVILRALLKQQLLCDESLSTLMCEVERVLNDRPITAVSSDSRDPAALTPADLLLLKNNSCAPVGTFAKEDLLTRRRWRQAQYLADVFWRRWLREYVPKLIARSKWQVEQRHIRPGDVVLVADKQVPRGQWPLGVVQEVRCGRDGLPRSAVVRMATSTLERPVTQMCLLESANDEQNAALGSGEPGHCNPE